VNISLKLNVDCRLWQTVILFSPSSTSLIITCTWFLYLSAIRLARACPPYDQCFWGFFIRGSYRKISLCYKVSTVLFKVNFSQIMWS
jgi:hypothetical protein